MAFIARAQEFDGMTPSSPVPIRSAGSAGIADAAVAEVGGDIEKVGQQVMQQYAKQQDMQDSNAYEISASKLETAYSTAYEQAKHQSNPDGSNFQDTLDKIVGPQVEDIMGQGPQDGPYADKLSTAQQVIQNKIAGHGVIQSLAMKEQFNAQGAADIGDTFADSVRENPTNDMVANRVQSYGSYIDDKVQKGIFTPEMRSKLMNSFNEKIGLSYVDGLANQGSYGQAVNALRANQASPDMVTSLQPDQAKSLGLITQDEADELTDQGATYDMPTLTGKDGAPLSPSLTKALSSIDPLKKNALIDQMKGKADAANNLKLSELNANVQGLEYIAYNGGQVSDDQINGVKAQINSNSSLTGFARVRLMDAVNTAQATNGAIQTMQTLPRAKWGSVIDSFDSRVQASQDQASSQDSRMSNASSDLAVQANRLQAKNHLESYAAKLAKSQGDDAAQFSLDSDPVMQSLYNGTKDGDPGASQKYAQQALSRQNYLQIPSEDRSILPNADARSLGAVLRGAQSTENADDFIHGLQQKWGPYYPQVFNEIVATDKTLQKYSAVTYAPVQTRFELVDAIKNQDAIKKSFDALPGKKDTNEGVSYAVDQKLRPFAQTISGSANDSSTLPIINNFRDALTLQVKREYVRGNTNINDATDKAYDDLIGSQFSIIQSKNSAVVAPKSFQGQPLMPDTISNYISNVSNPDGFKSLGALIPKDPTGKYERDPDSFYKDLQTTGKWVTNQNQDGIRLMTTNMDGSLQPIYNKYGQGIEVKYQNLLKDPKAYNSTKSMFDQINEQNKIKGAN